MTDLIIQGSSWNAMKEQAAVLVKSGLLPETIKTPEQAIAIAMKGHEIGMPMMQAFSDINIIKGKPSLSAVGMNSQIRKHCPGAKLEPVELTEQICRIFAQRPGERGHEFSFSMEDGKRAGITNNPSWQKWPKDMLWSRCVSHVARKVFPDCLNGVNYTPEELGADVEIEADGTMKVISETVQLEADKGAKEEMPEIPFEPTQQKIALAAKVKTGSVYTGATDQQQKVQAVLEQQGLDEAMWQAVHDKLMGKQSGELNKIIAEVKADGVKF